MIQGLMQQTPLLVSQILRFAETAHPSVRVVSRLVDEPTVRTSYAEIGARCRRLARALAALGVRPGDRVATLAWNTHRHLELMYAVPGMGAVLHTANPRLFEAQIRFVLDHGGAEILLFDKSFLPMVERLAPMLATVRRFVLLSAAPVASALDLLVYEDLLAAQPDDELAWPGLDENAGALLCYTSGTTGDPKGVLYSHRSIVLHAMASGLSGAMNIGAFDAIMPCSSLYHASGWGLPYIAPINGAALVLPCERFDPASLHALIAGEGVTFAAGVPTIWTAYLTHLDALGEAPGRLQRVLIGGSAVPRALFEAFAARGVTLLQLWGMTETSPVGVAATSTPALVEATDGQIEPVLWQRQGRRLFGVEARTVNEDGQTLPEDGERSGALQVRGPWVIERYYRAERPAVDGEGWFDTGDIATIDPLGYVRLTDRAKDVIKSGGEWVSSIDLENEAAACPGVRIAAAVGVPHPKWDERPILVIERHDESTLAAEAVIEFLTGRVVKWWLPDRVIFDTVPLTATGKIDKKALRARFRDIFSAASNAPS